MEVHNPTVPGPDEPGEGWVSGPVLFDTEITSLTLCRYSGQPVRSDEPCSSRLAGLHRDAECRSLYFQAKALSTGALDQAAFPDAQDVIRAHSAGADPIGTTS